MTNQTELDEVKKVLGVIDQPVMSKNHLSISG
jgi:hypothetical protein